MTAGMMHALQCVGWVERRENYHTVGIMMGFAPHLHFVGNAADADFQLMTRDLIRATTALVGNLHIRKAKNQ